MWLNWISLVLSLSELTQLLVCRLLRLSPNLESCQSLFLQLFFQPVLFFLFWGGDFSDTNARRFVVPLVPEAACFPRPPGLFSFFCSVPIIPMNSVFNFPLSFVHSVLLLSPSVSFSILRIYFLVPKFPFVSSLYLLFLWWQFLFFMCFECP